MHMVFALLCFVVVIHWLIFPYPSGLLHWHCGNLTIAPVPAKQPWWIWINTSCEFIMNDCITTTKQSTTKPCAYFLGYTVSVGPVHISKFKRIHHCNCRWPTLAPNGDRLSTATAMMIMLDILLQGLFFVFQLRLGGSKWTTISFKISLRFKIFSIVDSLRSEFVVVHVWKVSLKISLRFKIFSIVDSLRSEFVVVHVLKGRQLLNIRHQYHSKLRYVLNFSDHLKKSNYVYGKFQYSY